MHSMCKAMLLNMVNVKVRVKVKVLQSPCSSVVLIHTPLMVILAVLLLSAVI